MGTDNSTSLSFKKQIEKFYVVQRQNKIISESVLPSHKSERIDAANIFLLVAGL